MNKKTIEIIDKIDNETERHEYEDGTFQDFKVIKINSRKHALNLCEKYTRKALNKHDAFEKLHLFRNRKSFDRLRNYEVEEYLDMVSDKKRPHKIDELCPYNGFKWFD